MNIEEALAREIDAIPMVSTHAHFKGATKYRDGDAFMETARLYFHLSGQWRPSAPNGHEDPPLTSRTTDETHQHVFRVRMIVRTLQEVFGYQEERLTRDGISEILPQLNAIRGDDEVAAMHKALDLANIRLQVVDRLDSGQCTERIRTVRRFENQPSWERARESGRSFGEYLAFRAELVRDWAAADEVVALKVPFAYLRTLALTDPDEAEARAAYSRGPEAGPVERRAIEDYLVRHGLRQCNDYGLPAQIHTGFGWSTGTPLHLDHGDVSNLVPLFEAPEFRDLRFLVFHGSWPNTGTMGYLAASYENVYLDFNCLVALSRDVAVRCLSEWLDIVPLYKLMTGTDGPYLEWWVASARETRKVLTDVLCRKVGQGLYNEDLALDAARAILRTNAEEAVGF